MEVDQIFNIFESKPENVITGNDSESTELKLTDTSDNTALLNSILESNKRTFDEEDSPVSKKAKLDIEEFNFDKGLNSIKVHKVETNEGCLHDVAVPCDDEFTPLIAPTSKPAKEYNFELDPFQKEAILCLENMQSVLISAHTSAGKTVVAAYAISMALRDKQRVIYTTPIKALSNQKFREFFEEFKDVGLMTGDVTINPTASVLIMTTEILRSMLYRGSEVMKEVGWVIFDEIHYMRDKERGVVWEETIILLPDNVHYVFLSATIPNAIQFAEWICYLHKQPCHVVYTENRPVPLQHYIYPSGTSGLHLVVDEKSNFLDHNFKKAINSIPTPEDSSRKNDQNANRSDCFKLVKMVMELKFAPVIVFSFSRKECENHARTVSNLDFNSDSEKKLVEEVFNNALEVLSDEDRKLPQVEKVLPLLKRGIGIHHSGILPILKETVEILFSEGLIKALFATETFAMGLNMPARTVLFTNVNKFDGKNMRFVSSGEYIQMSGRAGRRGIDQKGIIILILNEKMDSEAAKLMIKGQTDPLNSAFHLSYNMIMNLLRVDGINPEFMMQRSFCQFQNYTSLPKLSKKVKDLASQHDSIIVDREPLVKAYYLIRQNLEALAQKFKEYITQPKYCVPFLQPGRMIGIKQNNVDFGWGIVVNFQMKKVPAKEGSNQTKTVFIVDALLEVVKNSYNRADIKDLQPCTPGEEGEMIVIPINLQLLNKISSVKLYFPQDLRTLENRQSVRRSIQGVIKKFSQGVPLLDPIDDMKIQDKEFSDIVHKIKDFEDRLKNHALHSDPNLTELYDLYSEKAKIAEELKETSADLKKKKKLLNLDELECRKRILRRLKYCTKTEVVELKGRVACEISNVDDLLPTELIFQGLLNDLDAAQIGALVSCFVFQEKTSDGNRILTEELVEPFKKIQDLARMIARTSKASGLEIDEQEYVDSFKADLIDIVYRWCKGAPFLEISTMRDIFEGSIIRSFRRLEELLRQMAQAAKTIGNKELENKFFEAIKLIKRDIVFAASLYL